MARVRVGSYGIACRRVAWSVTVPAREEFVRPSRRVPNWPLVAAIVAAVVLRVACWIDLPSDVRIGVPLLDARYYFDQAASFARGEGWPDEPFHFNPLYPTLLGGLFALTGPSVFAAHLAQSLLGLGALALLYVAARRWLGAGPAGWATLLAALSGPMLAMEAHVLGESTMLFLVAAALATWPGAPSRRSTLRGLCFGLLCGGLAISRGTFLLLPLAAWGAVLWASRTTKPSTAHSPAARSSTREIAAGALALALAFAPVAIHQTRTTGSLQFFTLNSGLNLYVGNNATARGGYAAPREIDLEQDPTARRSASILAGRDLSLAQADRLWRDRALDFLRNSPGRALTNVGAKLALFFRPDEPPQIDHFGMLARDHWPLRAAFVGFGWLAPLGLLGLLLAGRDERKRLAPSLIVIGIGLLSALVFFSTGRYRLPVLPGFWLLAGLGAHLLVEAWRARRKSGERAGAAQRKRVGMAIAASAVMAAGLWLLPGPDARATEAFDAFQVGVRQAQSGRFAEALLSYERAARLTPDDPEPWNNLGATLVKLGRLEEGRDAYTRAVELNPRATSLYNLGIVQARLGREDLALATLLRAAAADPLDPRIQSDLGIALARAGRRDEAIARWREALRLRPGFGPALQALRAVEAAEGGSPQPPG